MIRKRIGAFVAAAAATGGGANAAACWRPDEARAAQVRHAQTMLMVATLRCRAAHIDIVADYDGFVSRQTSAIADANSRIRRHFAEAGGGRTDYDRFATALADAFGDGETSESSCAEAAATAREAGDAADAAALDATVAARVVPAALAGGPCATPAFIPVVVPPAPEPAALPAGVVAALTAMARFRDADARMPAPVPTLLAAAIR